MAKKKNVELVALRNIFVEGDPVERGYEFEVDSSMAAELIATGKAVTVKEAAAHFPDLKKESKGK